MEGRKIRIEIEGLEFTIEINSTQLADLVWDKLPMEGSINLWGDEIYFQTDIEFEPNDLKQVVGIGDVAFWPPGKALCLFFGQTPMSTRDEIRPASGVDVFGKLLVEPKLLKVVKPGQSINLAKVQDLS